MASDQTVGRWPEVVSGFARLARRNRAGDPVRSAEWRRVSRRGSQPLSVDHEPRAAFDGGARSTVSRRRDCPVSCISPTTISESFGATRAAEVAALHVGTEAAVVPNLSFIEEQLAMLPCDLTRHNDPLKARSTPTTDATRRAPPGVRCRLAGSIVRVPSASRLTPARPRAPRR